MVVILQLAFINSSKISNIIDDKISNHSLETLQINV